MTPEEATRTVDKLRRQQAALAQFGSFAFKETSLNAILMEAARICAASLEVPFCKVCRYRPDQDDLLIEAGCGWNIGVVGGVVSQADETSPQGRAYVTREPVIIRDVRNANNLRLPHFYSDHGIISTVDVVIATLDGQPYGVLEIDSPTLHEYDEHDINFLKGFANVLAEAVATTQKNEEIQMLLAQQRLMSDAVAATLLDEKAASALREQFIAVLGHDLRNPLMSISAGASMLIRRPDHTGMIAEQMLETTVRMNSLIADVLDFARGRLGGGVKLTRGIPMSIEPVLQQVISELRSARPERTVEVDISVPGVVDCDPVRVGQLFSNLLGNAISHGETSKPIQIKARTEAGFFNLSVANAGLPIPSSSLVSLFEPFFRANARPSREGLGLGLYIASEIAHAHNGTLDVTSTASITQFTFRMPLDRGIA
jgi:signal transduction histidine kinase